MDILHSGCKERVLVSINTDYVYFQIKGKLNYPGSVEMIIDEKSSITGICGSQSTFTVLDKEIKDELCFSKKTIPLFYEQQNYEICIEKKANIEKDSNMDIEFFHVNKEIRESVTKLATQYPILSGVINFRNDIGYSDLIVKINGEEYIKLTIEVFPSKIDYQHDYVMMLSDISKEFYNLSFDFMRKTYQHVSLKNVQKNTDTEYYSIVCKIFDLLNRAVNIILNQTHHTLMIQQQIVPEHKLKNIYPQTVRWLERHPQYMKRDSQGRLLISKAMTIHKKITYDTLENRFVKYILMEVQKRLENLLENYENIISVKDFSRGTNSSIIANINWMIGMIKNYLNRDFFRQIEDWTNSKSMSLVFSMAPGYRELYKYYLMLKKGLSIHSSVFNMSMKDTALLYEYWCFIKLNSILRANYKLEFQDLLKVNEQGLFITLQKGLRSTVKYKNLLNESKIELVYNKSSQKLPTTPQKPDNILSLTKKDNGQTYQYIFDAKYRIDLGFKSIDDNRKSYGPGPKAEDINTMHRYRDAIVCKSGEMGEYKRTMFGAYVLFPHNEQEKYKTHPFYESIEKVNVGGFPFLPSTTRLVENFINKLVGESSTSAFKRATLPVGIEDRMENSNDENVLVCKIGSKFQLDYFIDNNCYTIPKRLLSNANLAIEYIALDQSKSTNFSESGIHYCAKVENVKEMKSSKLPLSIQSEFTCEEEMYFYKVSSWKELKNTIDISDKSGNSIYYINHDILTNRKGN